MRSFTTLVILFAIAGGLSAQNLNVVPTQYGKVSGTCDRSGQVHIFRGIPYAAPPVGNLRWKDPQPVESWRGVRKCISFAASAMQGDPEPFGVYTREFLISKVPISEDCLYLNLWTAAKHPGEKRPVFVWIHGGAFVAGGSSVPVYDGEAMARKGIVFVSINYRLGIFGFFAHPALTRESPHHASGNYGLLDQIAALRWVKNNIAAFGGDPDRVTIGGQSAGSMSVNCLVASPLSKGLFIRAIAESGANFAGRNTKRMTLREAEREGVAFLAGQHIHSLGQARKLSAEALLKDFPGGYTFITDGYVLPKPIPDIFADSQENKVDLMTGWNGDDGFASAPEKPELYRLRIREEYGKDADQFLHYYPGNSGAEVEHSLHLFARDTYGLQNDTWANIVSEQGNKRVFVYNFNRKVPADAAMAKYGAFHTAEVPYAYGNLRFLSRPLTKSDDRLSSLMNAYWINFIETGNPSGKDLPPWPAYQWKHPVIMVFDRKSESELLPDRKKFEFLTLALSHRK